MIYNITIEVEPQFHTVGAISDAIAVAAARARAGLAALNRPLQVDEQYEIGPDGREASITINRSE